MANLAVFCSGNGSNFEAICEAVEKRKLRAKVALMVCDRAEAFALKRAAKNGVPVFFLSPKHFKSRRDYEKMVVRVLKTQKVDLVVLAGFMRIFTPYFIGAYRGRILNIHPSYLPDFKGAHAIRDAFQAGVKVTGITVHVVTKKVDAGPILIQRRVQISREDILTSLEHKIHRMEHKIYPLAINKFLLRMN